MAAAADIFRSLDFKWHILSRQRWGLRDVRPLIHRTALPRFTSRRFSRNGSRLFHSRFGNGLHESNRTDHGGDGPLNFGSARHDIPHPNADPIQVKPDSRMKERDPSSGLVSCSLIFNPPAANTGFYLISLNAIPIINCIEPGRCMQISVPATAAD